jgi:ribosomal protein L11 methyltransferase
VYWLEVSVITDGEGAEAISEALRPYAYNDGIVLEQLGDANDHAPDALETAVTVKIYIPEEQDTPALRQRIEKIIYLLGRLYPLPPPTYRQLEEEDWANAWKAHYQPFRIGNHIWIQPSWIDLQTDSSQISNDLQPDDIVLILDPGMAFGTGLHPTTQMCLRAIEELVQPGSAVLDVGTGSGILAIAASKLGAGRLLAVDLDDVAVKTAVANADQNGTHNIHIRQGSLAAVLEKDWDLVVVNILAPIIISFLDSGDLMDYVTLNGHLILSGIIDDQVNDVKAAVASAGGKIVNTITIRDWVTFVVKHMYR